MPAKKERRIGGDATREIIKDVLLILGASAPNDATQRRRLEQTIRYGLSLIRRNSKKTIASGRHGVMTDKQKKAAAKVEAAIRRLQSTLRDQNLVRQWPEEDDDQFNASLEARRKRYEADAQKTLREQRYRAVDRSKRQAAKTAAKVCEICDLPLSLGLNSHFVKITTVICGKEGTDLRGVCATIERELRSKTP